MKFTKMIIRVNSKIFVKYPKVQAMIYASYDMVKLDASSRWSFHPNSDDDHRVDAPHFTYVAICDELLIWFSSLCHFVSLSW